jgi:hypothetical protein
VQLFELQLPFEQVEEPQSVYSLSCVEFKQYEDVVPALLHV